MDGKQRIYLVGVISEDPETHAWRNKAAKLLGDSFHVDNPVVSKFDKDLLRKTTGNDEKLQELLGEYHSELLLPKSYQSVEKCDIILINLQIGGEGHAGHLMELAWAYALHKTVIAIRGSDFRSKHPMVKGVVHAWADDLEEAIEIVKQFYLKR